MTLLIILGILLLLILLVFVVPYGVDIIYRDEILRLGIKAGPIRIWILPKKPKSPKQQEKARRKKEKKEAKKAAKKAAKEAKDAEKKKNGIKDDKQKVKEKKKPGFDFILALLKMGAHAIRRFFRSFSIDFFGLHFTVATDDPYKTAIQYGSICSAVEALPSIAGNVIHIKKKDICIGSDFTVSKPTADIRITLSLQLCKIVHVAFAFAAEFIKWKIKHPGEDPAEAMERMNDNGRE